MDWSRFRLFFRGDRTHRRRRTYHPDDYGTIRGLILNLKKDEKRDGRIEETPLQSLIGNVTNRPPNHGKERKGTRQIAKLIDQLGKDRPMKQTGGLSPSPMMVLEGALSVMVLAFLISFFVRDLSAFLKL